MDIESEESGVKNKKIIFDNRITEEINTVL